MHNYDVISLIIAHAQVMIDIGNGQKIPMNIPAANLGISLPSLIAASSSSPSSSAASTISVAPSIAPVFVTASPPAKPPQPPPPIPQIVVTDHRDETPAPSVDAKQVHIVSSRVVAYLILSYIVLYYLVLYFMYYKCMCIIYSIYIYIYTDNFTIIFYYIH